MAMTTYEKMMYYVLVIFALASNISTGVTSTCIVLAGLLVLAQRIKTGCWPFFDKQLAKILLAYGIMQCIIAAFSLNPAVSFGDVWATMYRFLPLFFAMGYLQNRRQIQVVLMAFMLSVFITDVVGMYQFLVLDINRPAGLSNTATFFASNLLMALPVLYMIYRENRGCLGKLAAVLAVFTFFMLILSGTRGGWIAFAGVFVLLLALDRWNRKKNIALALCLCVLCGGIFTFQQDFSQRIESITDASHASNRERLLMWNAAVEIFQDYPVCGVGQDQFQYVYNTQYISPLARERSDNDYTRGHGHPHNNFFKFLSEGGIIGVTAFLLLHGYFIWRMLCLYRQEKDRKSISFGMVGLLIIAGMHIEGLTDTNVTQVPLMREYWFLMGMLLNSGRLEN